MEKLLYPLWKDSSLSGDAFREELLHQLAPELAALKEVHGLRICVADNAVAAASKRRIQSQPPVADAMLSLWVDFAGAAAWRVWARRRGVPGGSSARGRGIVAAAAVTTPGVDSKPRAL